MGGQSINWDKERRRQLAASSVDAAKESETPHWQRKAFAVAREFWKDRRTLLWRQRMDAKRDAEAEWMERTLQEMGVPDLASAKLPIAEVNMAIHPYKGRQTTYVIWPYGDVFVKIGKSAETLRRLRDLQTSSPRHLVTLVTVHDGEHGWNEERLHERFRQQRVRGEWFELAGELLDWLKPALERAMSELDSGEEG